MERALGLRVDAHAILFHFERPELSSKHRYKPCSNDQNVRYLLLQNNYPSEDADHPSPSVRTGDSSLQNLARVGAIDGRKQSNNVGDVRSEIVFWPQVTKYHRQDKFIRTNHSEISLDRSNALDIDVDVDVYALVQYCAEHALRSREALYTCRRVQCISATRDDVRIQAAFEFAHYV